MSALDKIIEEYESLESKLFSGECLEELKSRLLQMIECEVKIIRGLTDVCEEYKPLIKLYEEGVFNVKDVELNWGANLSNSYFSAVVEITDNEDLVVCFNIPLRLSKFEKRLKYLKESAAEMEMKMEKDKDYELYLELKERFDGKNT